MSNNDLSGALPRARGGIRNIGILAHIDAGKTSLTERILFLSGRIRSAGDVDSGTTATDYLKVERERGITVKAACVSFAWRACTINLIDTPGHVDFGAEVERSLRVLDGAVLALCGVAGVQSRTETILKDCAALGLPLVCFVNKMDRRGASFERAFAEFAAVCPSALVVGLPIGEGAEHRGVLDLVTMEARLGGPGPAATAPGAAPAAAAPGAAPASSAAATAPGAAVPAASPSSLPAALLAKAAEARARLVERLAENDDELMAAYALGGEVGAPELSRALRAACLTGAVVPVLCGTAFSDTAVEGLLDAVADWLPSPEERGCPPGSDPATGQALTRAARRDAPLSSLVFKTQADEHFGRLSWLRIWSGSLRPGASLLDVVTGGNLKVQRIFSIQADRLEGLEEAGAGDIAAVALLGTGKQAGGRAGRQGTRASGLTGASLCDPAAPILYEKMAFEEAVVSMALEPVAKADGDALRAALALLLEEDPSLRASEEGETGRVTLSGMGELHLEVAVERLRTERGVRLRAGRPQVACREALRASAEALCDFDRDMGGERLRGLLKLALAPGERGRGGSLVLAPGLRLAPGFVEAVRRGVEASLSVGPASAWPVDDYVATILACSPPNSGQAELALEMAASMAARDCLLSAGTLVLEPWMRLELRTQEDCLGQAVSALTARGGRIEAIEDDAGGKSIQAAAPLRLLFGFASDLRSATAGRASYHASFLRFEAERAARP